CLLAYGFLLFQNVNPKAQHRIHATSLEGFLRPFQQRSSHAQRSKSRHERRESFLLSLLQVIDPHQTQLYLRRARGEIEQMLGFGDGFIEAPGHEQCLQKIAADRERQWIGLKRTADLSDGFRVFALRGEEPRVPAMCCWVFGLQPDRSLE